MSDAQRHRATIAHRPPRRAAASFCRGYKCVPLVHRAVYVRDDVRDTSATARRSTCVPRARLTPACSRAHPPLVRGLVRGSARAGGEFAANTRYCAMRQSPSRPYVRPILSPGRKKKGGFGAPPVILHTNSVSIACARAVNPSKLRIQHTTWRTTTAGNTPGWCCCSHSREAAHLGCRFYAF